MRAKDRPEPGRSASVSPRHIVVANFLSARNQLFFIDSIALCRDIRLRFIVESFWLSLAKFSPRTRMV